jgi:ABC-2 type transport system permease protein
MTRSPGLVAAIRSEWIKFRSVRSTVIGTLLMFILTIGIGILIGLAVKGHLQTMTPVERATLDPIALSMGGILFAQFAVGVIGALMITSEYSSTSIRTSLAAVPNRLRLIAAKGIVLSLVLLVVGEIASVIAYFDGTLIFRGTVAALPTLTQGHTLQAVLMGGAYLTMMGLFGFGLGLVLRQSAGSISTYTSLLLILPILVFLLPSSWQNTITRYEPSVLGQAMRSTTGKIDGGTAVFSTWTSAAILLAYCVVMVGAGVVLMQRRDA